MELHGKIRQRILPLILFLRSRRRHLLEAHCICLVDNYPAIKGIEAATFLQQYIDNVSEDDVRGGLYKAIATTRLARHLMSETHDTAKQYLDESEKYFASQNYLSHLASCELARIELQHSTHSTSNRIDQLCALARRSGTLGDIEIELAVVTLVLRLFTGKTHMWSQIEPVVIDLEHNLENAGSTFRLHSLHIVKYNTLSCLVEEAESSRHHLEAYLSSSPPFPLTPGLYSDVHSALYRCYSELGDLDSALRYAELEMASQAVKIQMYRMSDARYRYEKARTAQLLRSKTAFTQDASDTLINAARRLEYWVEWDMKNSRSSSWRLKAQMLFYIYQKLDIMLGRDSGFLEKYNYWAKQLESPDDHLRPLRAFDVGCLDMAVQHRLHVKRFKEAVEVAEQTVEKIRLDPLAPPVDIARARTILAIAMDRYFPLVEAESKDLAQDFCAKLWHVLLDDSNVLYLYQSVDNLSHRAPALCNTAFRYIKYFPGQKNQVLESMRAYIWRSDAIIRRVQESLNESESLHQLLRRRHISSLVSLRKFYDNTSEFLIRAGEETTWAWLQQKRGQALVHILAERSTAYEEIESSFRKNDKIRDIMSVEDTLATEVRGADVRDSMLAVDRLKRHQKEMKKVPALSDLLSVKDYNSEHWSQLDDIWSVSQWLPQGANIILIDWFVSPLGNIYWVTRQFKKKTTTHYRRVPIGAKEVKNWISIYLQFPKDRMNALEQDSKAAWYLARLLTDLDKICKSGDLVILTPSAELASLPIHAIPLNGIPWIEQNQIIYSSSFSLYRECLSRSRRMCSDLVNSVFTAAYEDAGHEEERENIINEVKNLAKSVGGRVIVGSDLTNQSMHTALISSPWVHYHGHAYYETSEPLRQGYILSHEYTGVGRASTAIEAEVLESATDGLEKIVHNNSLTKVDDLLFNLLKNTSRLTASDIFSLDLSANRPFICNIACSSGMQDVTEGDEPLGLVTALLVAGASSVLGTLWPIQSHVGRRFSFHFYQSIERQRKTFEKSSDSYVVVLNLAQALREAMIVVKKESKDPYSWAAFVLHGAGFFIYETQAKSLGTRGSPY